MVVLAKQVKVLEIFFNLSQWQQIPPLAAVPAEESQVEVIEEDLEVIDRRLHSHRYCNRSPVLQVLPVVSTLVARQLILQVLVVVYLGLIAVVEVAVLLFSAAVV